MKYKEEEETRRDRRLGKPVDNQSRDKREYKTRPEGINPRPKGPIAPGPLRSQPAPRYLEGKVNKDDQSKILAFEAFLDKFKTASCFISCKANLCK